MIAHLGPPADPAQPAAPLRSAATVLLLRDGPTGTECFLLRRAGGAGFMANATVFPGGKVDADDHLLGTPPPPTLLAAAAPALRGDAHAIAACFGAAVRELCEEAGIVLARDETGEVVAPARAAAVAAAVAAERDGHRVPAAAFARALAAHRLRADLTTVAPFAWWVTPKIERMRFDTVFFCAVLPAGQDAAVDGVEGTEGGWMRAADAVAAHNAGGRQLLPPPTLHTLLRVAATPGDASAVQRALGAGGVGPRLMPHFVPDAEPTPFIAMPDDPAHPEALPTDAGRRHRFVLQGNRFVHHAHDARLTPGA